MALRSGPAGGWKQSSGCPFLALEPLVQEMRVEIKLHTTKGVFHWASAIAHCPSQTNHNVMGAIGNNPIPSQIVIARLLT